MDISNTIQPDSDQLDAIDLVGGERLFTITKVSKGSAEQPVQIGLAEFPRPWRPGKSMRRVLVAAWGADASQYVGRRVVLFMDPDIRFGSERTGGTRIRAMSDLPGGKRLSVPLLVSRGKSAIFTVEPLTDAPEPTQPTADQIAACTDVSELGAMWKSAPALRPQIESRVAELKAAPEPEPDQPLIGAPE